jgi:hypothetical protein
MKMKMVVFAVIAMAACTVLAQARDDKKPAVKNAALQPFKQLAGEWTGKGSHGGQTHDVRVVYNVTSAGSAVVETIDPGGDHEMITVIHPDGDELALTHYCAIGNQPHMKAKPRSGDNKVAFEFVKASNMKSDKDMHMHSVTFTFVDKDTLRTEWTNYDGGKEAGKATFALTRKK